MTYTVSVTSQGQVSIPAPLRRKLGLNKSRKALISEQNGKLLIEPVQDLLDLRGSLKTATTRSPRQMRRAFEDYLGKKRINDP